MELEQNIIIQCIKTCMQLPHRISNDTVLRIKVFETLFLHNLYK